MMQVLMLGVLLLLLLLLPLCGCDAVSHLQRLAAANFFAKLHSTFYFSTSAMS